jgi:hypothetical protein
MHSIVGGDIFPQAGRHHNTMVAVNTVPTTAAATVAKQAPISTIQRATVDLRLAPYRRHGIFVKVAIHDR